MLPVIAPTVLAPAAAVRLPSDRMPALTLAWPVKLLAPVRTRVPPPALVRSAVPDTWPATVSWPTSTSRVPAARRLTGPVTPLAPVRLSRVPPLRSRPSATLTPPCSCSVAPLPTIVPAAFTVEALAVLFSETWLPLPPRAALFWTLTTPARMLVWAVYVLAPVRVSVPAPALVNDLAGPKGLSPTLPAMIVGAVLV